MLYQEQQHLWTVSRRVTVIYVVQDGSTLHQGYTIKFTCSTKTIHECLLHRLFRSKGEITGHASALIFSNNKVENRNGNGRCFQQSTFPAISCRMVDADRSVSHIKFKMLEYCSRHGD
jgi:hypothetical protein